MLTDKIKELLNLNNKDNFIINDLIQDNINLLFNNKIETQKNNEISTNLNFNILEKDLTNILQNELNVEKDNDLKSNLNDSNLQQELIDLFCFFYHYINNNQNNLINSQTIDTDNITDNKSQLNINLNDIVNFNYFKILSNHFINNQTIQNIYDNNKYQINKENQQQINNNFIDLNKVKQFISDIIKTFETNHLEQELNVIIPRYSFKIDSKNILNQNTFDELEKNVDILKNFQRSPLKLIIYLI